VVPKENTTGAQQDQVSLHLTLGFGEKQGDCIPGLQDQPAPKDVKGSPYYRIRRLQTTVRLVQYIT